MGAASSGSRSSHLSKDLDNTKRFLAVGEEEEEGAMQKNIGGKKGADHFSFLFSGDMTVWLL